MYGNKTPALGTSLLGPMTAIKEYLCGQLFAGCWGYQKNYREGSTTTLGRGQMAQEGIQSQH